MRQSKIGRAAVSIALAYATCGTVSAGPEASPVHITQCDVVPQTAPRHGVTQEVIRISFSIDGAAAADEAHFVASFEKNQAKGFVARGLFSKGVIIADRLVPVSPEQVAFDALHGHLGCVATYVHFVDGTSWTASQS